MINRAGVPDTGSVVDLTVELCGIPLATPLIPAAGTLGREALGESKGVWGALLPKTVTPEPRSGNPPPRIAEVSSGMVNSIGLQNAGLDHFLENLGDYDGGIPLFVSVAAQTVGQFAETCEKLAGEERISALELNLSCPNVEHGGLKFCAGPWAVKEVVAACRGSVSDKKPLFTKLTNEGVVANAVAAEEAGADAVTVINTIPGLVVDPRERKVLLRGGLSGPAIKPVALRAVYEVSRAVAVPVIGVGGVTTGTDIAEFMLAGATAVQVGSGGFVREPREMLEEFVTYLQQNDLRARDLTGALVEH